MAATRRTSRTITTAPTGRPWRPSGTTSGRSRRSVAFARVPQRRNDAPMPDSAERVLHVLVAGGGVAGLETLLALRDLAGDRVRLTLLTPEEDFVYRPMAVSEPFSRGRAKRVPLS